jgi:hypothetical protein
MESELVLTELHPENIKAQLEAIKSVENSIDLVFNL